MDANCIVNGKRKNTNMDLVEYLLEDEIGSILTAGIIIILTGVLLSYIHRAACSGVLNTCMI